MVKDKLQRLLYAPIKGTFEIYVDGFPRCRGLMVPRSVVSVSSSVSRESWRNKERDTRGSLIDYESHKIKRTVLSTTVAELYAFMKCYGSAQFYRGLWMDMTAQPIEVHLRTDANNLVTTASTRLPEQKETIHTIQMLRQEARSGQMHDLAHVLTQVDTHPPFRSTVQHKAFITEIVYPDAEATEDHWGHLMCYPVFFKIQERHGSVCPF